MTIKDKKPILYVIVPCYNEEEVLFETNNQLVNKLHCMISNKLISQKSSILYIDDGSKDNTWNIIHNLHLNDTMIQGIKLSKNFGHQNALVAGLSSVVDLCDITITIDADLQDDINAIDDFVEKYKNGCQIVYGTRGSRKADSSFKRNTAELYYKLLEKLGVNIIYNHADYRLMSKEALKHLLDYKEVNLFLRGIVPSIGLKTDTVEYERKERLAGKSKYPLKKMVSFAIEGITSFSIKPIYFISIMGIVMFAVSIILSIYYIIGSIKGNTITGWATIVVSLWAIGGMLLLSMGVIGIYIGKIYLETKNRPRFFIEINTNDEK